MYRSDLSIIESIIKSNFIIEKNEILSNKKQFSLGYMSDHYIVKLFDRYEGPRYNGIKELKCEIQVRTISMHAWNTVSHHLDYKKEVDIPSKFRNDFNALSGVFYIADTLFEQFKDSRHELIESMLKSIKNDEFDLDMEINMDTLDAFIWWKFPNRYNPDDKDHSYLLSSLLAEIIKLNIFNFKELNFIVDKHLNRLDEEDKKIIKANKLKQDTYFSGIGLVRGSLYYEYPQIEEEIFGDNNI